MEPYRHRKSRLTAQQSCFYTQFLSCDSISVILVHTNGTTYFLTFYFCPNRPLYIKNKLNQVEIQLLGQPTLPYRNAHYTSWVPYNHYQQSSHEAERREWKKESRQINNAISIELCRPHDQIYNFLNSSTDVSTWFYYIAMLALINVSLSLLLQKYDSTIL